MDRCSVEELTYWAGHQSFLMTDSGIMHQLSENLGLVFYPSMCIFFICILNNTNQPGLVEDAVVFWDLCRSLSRRRSGHGMGERPFLPKPTDCALAPCGITLSGGQGSWSFMLPRSSTKSSTEWSNAHRVNNCVCCDPLCLLWSTIFAMICRVCCDSICLLWSTFFGSTLLRSTVFAMIHSVCWDLLCLLWPTMPAVIHWVC